MFVGGRKKTRQIHTLFDDGSESRLLCVAFCKAQSEKFLPRRFSHERKLSQRQSRGQCADYGLIGLTRGPPYSAISRPAGRQTDCRPLTAGAAQRRTTYKWTIRFDSYSDSPPYFILNHGPRPSKGTLYMSFFNPLQLITSNPFPRLSF